MPAVFAKCLKISFSPRIRIWKSWGLEAPADKKLGICLEIAVLLPELDEEFALRESRLFS